MRGVHREVVSGGRLLFGREISRNQDRLVESGPRSYCASVSQMRFPLGCSRRRIFFLSGISNDILWVAIRPALDYPHR